MLKLPKAFATHPRADAVFQRFSRNERPLRDGSRVQVSWLPLDETLASALKAVYGTGHLTQGLELIAETLDREAKGLAMARAKTGQSASGRLSRLVLLADDGSERFYHDAESLLDRHGERVWGCRLTADAAALGAAFTPKGNPAKALLIADRQALELFLARLAGS